MLNKINQLPTVNCGYSPFCVMAEKATKHNQTDSEKGDDIFSLCSYLVLELGALSDLGH